MFGSQETWFPAVACWKELPLVPVKILGNVLDTPLMEIWNGSEYRAFRRRVLEADLPEHCRGCDYCRGMITL